MRKALLTSTALIMSAGIAAAEVSVGGDARVGVQSKDGGDATLNSRIRIKFGASGVTDGGMEFGGSMRADQVEKGGTQNGTAGEVYIKGPFGAVTMGDTDGGFDWALDEIGGAGSITDDHTSHDGYNGNSGLDSGQVLRYENTFGEIGFAASVSQEKNDDNVADGDTTLGFGVKGSLADFGIGAGFQSNDDKSIMGMSAKFGFGGMTGVLNYSATSVDGDDSMDMTYSGIGMTYGAGPMALNLNFGRHDYDNNDSDKDGFGAAAQYDLGGGAKAQIGVGSSGNDKESWSLGLNMSF